MARTKRRYSDAEKKAYNVGLGVGLARVASSPYEIQQNFSSQKSKNSYGKGFDRARAIGLNSVKSRKRKK